MARDGRWPVYNYMWTISVLEIDLYNWCCRSSLQSSLSPVVASRRVLLCLWSQSAPARMVFAIANGDGSVRMRLMAGSAVRGAQALVRKQKGVGHALDLRHWRSGIGGCRGWLLVCAVPFDGTYVFR